MRTTRWALPHPRATLGPSGGHRATAHPCATLGRPMDAMTPHTPVSHGDHQMGSNTPPCHTGTLRWMLWHLTQRVPQGVPQGPPGRHCDTTRPCDTLGPSVDAMTLQTPCHLGTTGLDAVAPFTTRGGCLGPLGGFVGQVTPHVPGPSGGHCDTSLSPCHSTTKWTHIPPHGTASHPLHTHTGQTPCRPDTQPLVTAVARGRTALRQTSPPYPSHQHPVPSLHGPEKTPACAHTHAHPAAGPARAGGAQGGGRGGLRPGACLCALRRPSSPSLGAGPRSALLPGKLPRLPAPPPTARPLVTPPG